MSELYLHSVRSVAVSRLGQLRSDLTAADQTYGEHACVYATGSFGRLEAGERSDLDLFIVLETVKDGQGRDTAFLQNTDEIKLKYELISAAESNKVAKFDGGGRFLTAHTTGSFTKWLGSDQDDYRNTLTGRMLLLLESKYLVGSAVYDRVISNVIDHYFRDYAGHEGDFAPAFLVNDIMRMWRTFCVNYEFHRKEGDSRNKIKNLKLKFSRMLTCYSGIVYLQAVFARSGTVHPEDVRSMVSLSPTERLESLSTEEFGIAEDVRSALAAAITPGLNNYSQFLELVHQDVRKAVKEYASAESDWRNRSYEFGRSLSTIIDSLGRLSPAGDRLRRLLII